MLEHVFVNDVWPCFARGLLANIFLVSFSCLKASAVDFCRVLNMALEWVIKENEMNNISKTM